MSVKQSTVVAVVASVEYMSLPITVPTIESSNRRVRMCRS